MLDVLRKTVVDCTLPYTLAMKLNKKCIYNIFIILHVSTYIYINY